MIRVSGNFSDSSLLVFKAQNFLAGILLLILLTVVSIGAQDTVTGGFQGDVSDNRTGNPIAGAVVTIRSDQTGATYNLTTDSKGVFFQGLLAPGSY